MVRTISHIPPEMPRAATEKTVGGTFVGSPFTANIQSINHFFDNVLPLVLGQRPEFKFVIAGSVCRDVEDHRAITAGTGIKIKHIELMSCGLPAVSTALGWKEFILPSSKESGWLPKAPTRDLRTASSSFTTVPGFALSWSRRRLPPLSNGQTNRRRNSPR